MCSVGVKDGRVADEDMTASSSWDANHGPQYGRLYNQVSFSKPSYMGAWAAGAGKIDLRITAFYKLELSDQQTLWHITCDRKNFKLEIFP